MASGRQLRKRKQKNYFETEKVDEQEDDDQIEKEVKTPKKRKSSVPDSGNPSFNFFWWSFFFTISDLRISINGAVFFIPVYMYDFFQPFLDNV